MLIGVVQLPPGASLDRTERSARPRAEGRFGHRRDRQYRDLRGPRRVELFDRVERRHDVHSPEGLGGTWQRSQRHGAIGPALRRHARRALPEAKAFVIAPPAVPGLGNGSGFTMMIQDDRWRQLPRARTGYRRDDGRAAQEVPQVAQVFSLFNTGSPRIFADVDRDKAQMLGVQPGQVYAALGTYLASTYVNDFNLLGRTFRVTAQAEPTARAKIEPMSAGCRCARRRARWCRWRRSRRSATTAGRRASCVTTCSPRSNCRVRRRPAFRRARR